MANNYKTQTGTFKSLKHFSDKGMLAGQKNCNDNFYDIFAGNTCEFAIFEDYGETFHKDTAIQVNPEDIDFGCELCSGNTIETKNAMGYITEYSITECVLYIYTGDEHSSENMNINYCPMCGRKLKIDE